MTDSPSRPQPGVLPSVSLGSDGEFLLLTDGRGDEVGAVCLIDPLDGERPEERGREVALRSPASAIIILSGSLDPMAEPFAWMPRMRSRFEAFAAGIEEGLATRVGGGRPMIWPHASGAVSDAPSLQTFLRTRQDRGWSFVFDPAWLLTPDMMATAHDHCLRMFDLLGGHPAAGLFIEDERTRAFWPDGWQEPACPWNRLPRLVRPAAAEGG